MLTLNVSGNLCNINANAIVILNENSFTSERLEIKGTATGDSKGDSINDIMNDYTNHSNHYRIIAIRCFYSNNFFLPFKVCSFTHIYFFILYLYVYCCVSILLTYTQPFRLLKHLRYLFYYSHKDKTTYKTQSYNCVRVEYIITWILYKLLIQCIQGIICY